MNLKYTKLFSHWASFYFIPSINKKRKRPIRRKQAVAAKGSENPTIKLDFSNFKCHMMTWVVHAQEGVEVVAAAAQ